MAESHNDRIAALVNQAVTNIQEGKGPLDGLDFSGLPIETMSEVVTKMKEINDDPLADPALAISVDLIEGDFNEAFRRITEAAEIATKYGEYDGSHHKMWVITEMLKVLVGEKEFNRWKRAWEEKDYAWDEGVPP